MRDDLRLPDLTFPTVIYGTFATPWNLNRWLYKGGSAPGLKKVTAAIKSGELGDPLLERLALVQAIHDKLNGQVIGGASLATVIGQIETITRFFRWAETYEHPLTSEEIVTTFIHWTDHFAHRIQVLKNVSSRSAYSQAKVVSGVLAGALDLALQPISLSRLRGAKHPPKVQGVAADKQNLQETFAFGYFLQDICDGLPSKSVLGPLPVRIPLRCGDELVHWCGVKPEDKLILTKECAPTKRHAAKIATALRAARMNDRTLTTRRSLANLRIEAELLIFIAQTGMNLSQSHRLKLYHFSYGADGEFLKVREYKNRRGGEVLFTIYKEYKKHFERYLTWRRVLFPDSEKLFPTLRLHDSHIEAAPTFALIKSYLPPAANLKYVGPQKLRATRVNWFLRRSSDPNLTADEAQHSKEVLFGNYERPSQQRAVGEIMRFWTEIGDPTLARTTPVAPVAPGHCDGVPKVVSFKPKDAPSPDCIRASGCLWCDHHRDIDSLDYVWSLASFRHLKKLEVTRFLPPEFDTNKHPAEFAIERLNDKLNWFRNSAEERRSWVVEACSRVDEGNYHPDWDRLIHATEEEAS